MFETSKHVPKTEKGYCVFKDNCFIGLIRPFRQIYVIDQLRGPYIEKR